KTPAPTAMISNSVKITYMVLALVVEVGPVRVHRASIHTERALPAGGVPWLDGGDELRDQIAVEGFGAAFATDAAVLDAAEGRFGQGAAKVIDVHHAGFQRTRHAVCGLQRVREHVR